MMQKELRHQLKRIAAIEKEVTATPEAAKIFLHKTGIITKSGKLAPQYR